MAGARPSQDLGDDRPPVSRITDLPQLIDSLPADDRARAHALYDVSISTGQLTIPPELRDWVVAHFGSVEAVELQHVVRVTDRWTLNGAIFSPLRGRRPQSPPTESAFRRLVESTVGDEFCHPETGTPADTWGRIRGRRTITAANAAMYEARHGVVVFDQHDPLAFDEETVIEGQRGVSHGSSLRTEDAKQDDHHEHHRNSADHADRRGKALTPETELEGLVIHEDRPGVGR